MTFDLHRDIGYAPGVMEQIRFSLFNQGAQLPPSRLFLQVLRLDPLGRLRPSLVEIVDLLLGIEVALDLWGLCDHNSYVLSLVGSRCCYTTHASAGPPR